MKRQRTQKGQYTWTIQGNWQHWEHNTQDKDKQNKNTTQRVGHHYAQTTTNNVNKTLALLQTTGDKQDMSPPTYNWR